MIMNQAIIKNIDVLQEDYLPEKIIGRKKEIESIASSIRPLFYNKPMINLFLHGPTGTGKTSVIRYIIREVSKETSRIKGIYVNCWMDDTTYAVLLRIAEVLHPTMRLAKIKRSNAEILDLINFKKGNTKVFVVLDEVDKLKSDEILYMLSREGYGLIMISNYNIALNKLDRRVRSSLSYIDIEFEPYDYEDLYNILKERSKYAFYEGAFPEPFLKVAAKNAKGDARVGISIIRNAALFAEQQGKKKVDREDLLKALKSVKGAKEQELEKELKGKTKKIYEIVKGLGEADAKEISRIYKERFGEDIHERTLRYYLQELVEKGLIETKGEKRWKKYSSLI